MRIWVVEANLGNATQNACQHASHERIPHSVGLRGDVLLSQRRPVMLRAPSALDAEVDQPIPMAWHHNTDRLNQPMPLIDRCRTESRVWFTDPPYYDAVPYADLSDFFFVG